MRRRLRKKLRVGEFTELGFSVRADLTLGLDDAGFDAFLDRWIDAIEARGLAFGGGGRPEDFGGFVGRVPCVDDRGSISLSNLRVLGHEIAVGHAHFLLDTPAREGANVLPSASAGVV